PAPARWLSGGDWGPKAAVSSSYVGTSRVKFAGLVAISAVRQIGESTPEQPHCSAAQMSHAVWGWSPDCGPRPSPLPEGAMHLSSVGSSLFKQEPRIWLCQSAGGAPPRGAESY